MDYEKQKELDLKFGLDNEKIIKPILEKVFNKSLFSTIYKYSIFDFYDSKHKYLFELKSSKYSYSKYPTILIQTNKGLCENSVFIFSFICGYLCYIQYNKKIFNTFIKAVIPYRGLEIENYRIPKQNLIQINNDNIYRLKFVKLDYKINTKYIYNDKQQYFNTNRIKILIKKYYKSKYQYKYNINLLTSNKQLLHIDNFLTYITKQINNNNLYIKYLEPIKYEISI